jgi:trans-2,3-dihydro-3-hydroxyanthranilate isomerase
MALSQPGRTAVAFAIVDVFAERPLEGNPLPVIADAACLSEGARKQIARGFNQSETTCVSPPTKTGADWRWCSSRP